MAEEIENTDPAQSAEANSDEISLENIDAILAEEDPTFVESMEEIKEGAEELADAEIEALDVDENLDADDELEKVTGLQKLVNKYKWLNIPIKLYDKAKEFLGRRWLNLKNRFREIIFVIKAEVKTWPLKLKNYGSYGVSQLRAFVNSILSSFAKRTKFEKIMVIILIIGFSGVTVMAFLNAKGRWLMIGEQPIMTSLEMHAEKTWEYSFANESTKFLLAFPQPKHSYLFPKVVVNLRPSGRRQSIEMGAFEFYVEVDSKDTAIEIKSREVEFHDRIQRTTEGFSYASLQTERGKTRLKEEIKKNLNQYLAQGWVKEVYIKFFITSP